MDNTTYKKVQPVTRKAKKKQVKDGLDRMKQAEKKKRRLAKALATSAAIRSELEKKKQMKKEEQQRLDEEGAAIAEAAALHVLLGEDSDASCKVMLNEEKGFDLNPWEYPGNINMLMGRNGEYLPHRNFAVQEFGFTSNAFELRDDNCSISYEPFRRYDAYEQYFDKVGWDDMGLSAGLIAAQAVSSLQISEDAEVNSVVFNRMF